MLVQSELAFAPADFRRCRYYAILLEERCYRLAWTARWL